MGQVRPDFFIVGAPRAGTSALHEHLGRHPSVFVSPLKEPQFFGADQHHLGGHRYTLEDYLALFAPADRAMRVGEASTKYLSSRTAAMEIKEFSPSASIIIMLRNPIDVMRSYHAHQVASGFEPIRSFGEALAAEPERHAGRLIPEGPGVLENLYYRDVVDFATHVRRYFDAFGRDRVHVILFDDWRTATQGAYRDVLRFLDVSQDFMTDLDVVNESRRIRNQRLHGLIAEPPPRLKSLAGRLLPPAARGRLRYTLLDMNTRAGAPDPVEPALLRRLEAEFAPKIRELGALIKRDLSAWMSPWVAT